MRKRTKFIQHIECQTSFAYRSIHAEHRRDVLKLLSTLLQIGFNWKRSILPWCNYYFIRNDIDLTEINSYRGLFTVRVLNSKRRSPMSSAAFNVLILFNKIYSCFGLIVFNIEYSGNLKFFVRKEKINTKEVFVLGSFSVNQL